MLRLYQNKMTICKYH